MNVRDRVSSEPTILQMKCSYIPRHPEPSRAADRGGCKRSPLAADPKWSGARVEFRFGPTYTVFSEVDLRRVADRSLRVSTCKVGIERGTSRKLSKIFAVNSPALCSSTGTNLWLMGFANRYRSPSHSIAFALAAL